ncbi:hypothetical protein Rcae01_02913 [Novipirellula caenicola]|uniref:Uncharacterized protein n=1 Tax=Novipirellula caenicola TaxID=1536901 RepID=A0ABP9VUJ5_9BACT
MWGCWSRIVSKIAWVFARIDGTGSCSPKRVTRITSFDSRLEVTISFLRYSGPVVWIQWISEIDDWHL